MDKSMYEVKNIFMVFGNSDPDLFSPFSLLLLPLFFSLFSSLPPPLFT